MQLDYLKRCIAAVRKDAESTGSSRKRKLWNSRSLKELKRLAPTTTANEIAQLLGYSPSSVRKTCKAMHITIKRER